MDKNRKIIISILSFMILSCVLAFIDISFNMKQGKKTPMKIFTNQVGPGVGIVRVYGPITLSGESVSGSFRRMPGADQIVNQVDSYLQDSRIKAVVLRINSPGGTVAATQEIFQKLIQLRKRNIPIVVSMGDLAASGGYYIASAADYIYANHGTITGSIGVIIASPNLKGVFDKLGITMNVIKSGKYKDILSSHREMTSDEKKLLQNMIDSTYDKFLEDVVFGRSNVKFDRKLEKKDVKPYADGRVFSGVQAVKYKLVDDIGTFEDAVNKARELANLSKNSAVYEDLKSPWEKIIGSIEIIFNKNPLTAIIPEKNSSLIEYRYLP